MLTTDPTHFSSFPLSDITLIHVEIFAYRIFCGKVRDRQNRATKCYIQTWVA